MISRLCSRVEFMRFVQSSLLSCVLSLNSPNQTLQVLKIQTFPGHYRMNYCQNLPDFGILTNPWIKIMGPDFDHHFNWIFSRVA